MSGHLLPADTFCHDIVSKITGIQVHWGLTHFGVIMTRNACVKMTQEMMQNPSMDIFFIALLNSKQIFVQKSLLWCKRISQVSRKIRRP